MQYPKHIAIIPDGNRTWAKEKGLDSFFGHLEGFNQMIKIAKYVYAQTPIQVFTLWWLSTENLTNRSQGELDYLFDLYKQITEDLYDLFLQYRVNFRVAGDFEALPQDLVDFLKEKMKEFTFPDSEKAFVLAVNYGGQDEILRGIQKLCAQNLEITKQNFEQCLDFAGLPPVELVIRTKQELAKRLSGFMLWRIWYAQLYFTDLYCPDFTVKELEKALDRYDSTIGSQNFWK